ncbi:MAG TPA: glycyl-radical enzyme activating protein [Clostridia bacterium]|nr:glycyl-radical enzyme activating protein [Clostridia bacterium]
MGARVHHAAASNDSRIAGPMGSVFNIMRFSLHDGPGIRTTVFLKGCPLACLWCHNPESQAVKPGLMLSLDRCVRCGDCVPACKHGALTWNQGPVRDAAVCVNCGACAQVCPSGARQLSGRRMSVAEVCDAIRRDVVFFDESGGGVTFSGGEPLAQPQFLEAMLDACSELGIHKVVDTCAFSPKETVRRICRKVDTFLVDLKIMDASRHQQVTGVSNELILSNLAMLAREHASVIVRIPVIPTINDDDGNLEHSMKFLCEAGLHRVDLLAYHDIAINKYNRLGAQYDLAEVKPPTAERMEEIAGRFRDRGFDVRIGG